MCEECFEQYQPWAPITPDIMEAVGWLCALYEENAAGGMLHACVDDTNLPATERGDRCYLETTIEHCTLDALLKLSEHEQACATAILHGFYEPEGAPFEAEWSPEVRFAHEMAQGGCPTTWLYILLNTMNDEGVPGVEPIADLDAEFAFVSAHDRGANRVCGTCGTAYPCEPLKQKAWTYRELPGYNAEWKPKVDA